MSDLVEKVARAMHSHPSTFDGVRYENEEPEYRKIYEDKARAAIAAVAEWLAQSEDRECYPLQCLHNELEQPK